jgi:cytochrome c553
MTPEGFVEMKSLYVVALAALFATPVLADEAKSPAKPDVNKGSTISATVCVACHTSDGSRGIPTNPILQGQHADYLVKQLTEFKSGKRDNAIMKPMASQLSDDDMRNVAAFYESKQAKPGQSKAAADSRALGMKIWRAGIADKAVPACAGCHGPTGAGIPAQYARLAGQHAEYVSAELMLFRSGKRANSPQMATIAARMSDAEIAAVSDYAEGLNAGK